MPITDSDRADHARRRASVLGRLGPGEAMLLFGAHHHLRNGDAEYRFRQLSDVLYLCGWEDPDVALLLRPDAENPFTLFVQPKDPDREVWTGIREGPVGARERYEGCYTQICYSYRAPPQWNVRDLCRTGDQIRKSENGDSR